MDSTIRVLLADDHPLVRAGLRATLVAENDFSVVGEATNGHRVQRLCAELQPDVLLLDLSMPGPPPLEIINYLHMHCPQVRVLVLTIYDDDVYVRNMIRAGVAGYVLKDDATAALIRAIRTVAQGDTWFSRAVLTKLFRDNDPLAQERRPNLSVRERQILKLLAQGFDNGYIAAELRLAEQTVRNYVSRLYTRIGVRSRAEAVVWATRNGVVGE